MKQKLINYMSASFPCLAVRTAEEWRAADVVKSAAVALKRNAFCWSATSGIRQIHEGNGWQGYAGMSKEAIVENTITPMEAARETITALQRAGAKAPPYGVLIMCDLHSWVANLDPITERQIKELLRVAPQYGATVIFLGTDFKMPASWEKSVTILDFELPTREELDAILAKLEADFGRDKMAELTNGERENALRAASGLTAPEAENAYALALIEGKAEKKLRVETVYREKAGAVKRTGMLEIIEPDPRGLDAIGGLDALKTWIMERAACYSKKAKEYGLPAPRGLVAAGIPGTGKSLAAKCIGTALGVPTIKLDMGSLMGSLVGQSEANTRLALATAEAVAPCILFVDEIDKGLAGSKGGGELDSGVTRRVLGTLLSWAQDHKRDVFMFLTANQVWQLPPELLRKGRVDEIFYLSLPTATERKAIFKIHLEKRERLPKKFDLDKLAAASPDFTGSECEEAVIAAMYSAFGDGQEVATEHVVAACKATTPLAQTMKEDIQRIEEWGKTRARPASSVEAPKAETRARHFGGGHSADN